MKLLIDAHLPKRLANQLREIGHDVKHTRDLAQQNRTPDHEMNAISLRESRIVVTKDSDFVNSFFAQNKPYKLLLISTGNISNSELEELISTTITTISTGFSKYRFIELNQTTIIFHK